MTRTTAGRSRTPHQNNQRFGVAPGVTEVLVAKVLAEGGNTSREAIWAGLHWVINHPRKVDVICVAMGMDTRTI